MVTDIKNRSCLPKSCIGCKYCKHLSESNAKVYTCNYIFEVGRPKGCSIYNCTKYTKADTTETQT